MHPHRSSPSVSVRLRPSVYLFSHVSTSTPTATPLPSRLYGLDPSPACNKARQQPSASHRDPIHHPPTPAFPLHLPRSPSHHLSNNTSPSTCTCSIPCPSPCPPGIKAPIALSSSLSSLTSFTAAAERGESLIEDVSSPPPASWVGYAWIWMGTWVDCLLRWCDFRCGLFCARTNFVAAPAFCPPAGFCSTCPCRSSLDNVLPTVPVDSPDVAGSNPLSFSSLPIMSSVPTRT